MAMLIPIAATGWVRCLGWEHQEKKPPPRVPKEDIDWFCNDTNVVAAMRAGLNSPSPAETFSLPCAKSARTHSDHGHGRCKRCRCTFLDAGLNNGDSLMNWPRQLANSSWTPDSRTPANKRANADLARMRECLTMPAEDVCYYGFEIHPGFTTHLRSKQAALRDQGVRVHLFTETAFAVDDQGIDIHAEPIEGFSKESAYRTSIIKGLQYQAKNVERRHIASVDAAALVTHLAKTTDFLAAKVDIEGYEFELLRHWVLRRPASLCALRVLAVEWSMYQMPSHAGYFGVERMDLRKWITSDMCGVTFRKWA